MTTSDNSILKQHAYMKINKICDTLQGELFKAKQLSSNKYVAIKKTNKLLFQDYIAIEDETTFRVSEDIITEALILQYLTMDNKCIGRHITEYIDFFESDTDYYLVLEYIDSQLNLKQFVNISHSYIDQDKLDARDYWKIIKYLYWQLAVTIQWLHDSMHCCHLDLCSENIMVSNCKFTMGKNGKYKINPKVSIKLIDFGVSELFNIANHEGFKCNKQYLSLENEAYSAPKIYFDQTYDARYSDMWSMGMILYECLTGNRLYKPREIWEYEAAKTSNIPLPNSGYWSLYNNKLRTFVSKHDKNNIFKLNVSDLLFKLLNINEEKRLTGMDVLKHKWFKTYYNSYYQQIEKKSTSILQKKSLEKQKQYKATYLPFYELIKVNADNVL